MRIVDEYSVHFHGIVGVEAESEEEAKQKARDAVDHPMHGDIHDFEAENLSDREMEFQAKLMRTGSSVRNATTRMITGKSALTVSFHAVNSMLKSMVGKEDAPKLKYTLASLMFASLEFGGDVEKDKIWENIQKIDDHVKEDGFDWLEENMWTVVEGEDDSGRGDRP